MKVFSEFEVKNYLSQAVKNNRHDSQEKIAEKASISDDTLSLIERGITVPSTVSFINLCNALDVLPNDLLEGLILNQDKLINTKLCHEFSDLSIDEKSFVLSVVDFIKSHRI